MKEIIKNLSFKEEFVIVVAISFGYSIISSIILFIQGFFPTSNSQSSFTNESIVSLIIYELIILTVVIYFLNLRDNQINFKNNFKPLKLIWSSLLLTILYYFSYFLLVMLVSNIFFQSISSNDTVQFTSYRMNTFLIIAVSIINPIFEEAIVVGYIIPALKNRAGVLFAINISVLVRLLYHLYQGPIAVISIIPMGLIFAFVYIKWKNIWPLIIAHAIMDFIALSYYQF